MAKFNPDNSHPVGGYSIGFGQFIDGKLVAHHKAIPPISPETLIPKKRWPSPSASDIDDLHSFMVEMGTFTLQIDALDETLYAFLIADPHIAIASPKRWHTRQKRATCLRLKARDA